MNLELRAEQQQVVDDVSAAFRAGHRRVMISAPCGFGKTELATAVLAAAKNNGKRGAFAADRQSLVTQTGERFDKYGLDHGVVMGDHWRHRPHESVQIVSVQTVQRRGNKWPEVDMLVVDEAHNLNGAVREKLASKDCYAIGLSATAITPGLGKLFDAVVNAPSTNRLIEKGLLVPLRIFSCAEPDMNGVKAGTNGEFNTDESTKRCLQVVGDVVDEYVKHGGGKKFIGFAASIAHAQELERQFLAVGINVATYTADDLPESRHEVVQEFRKKESSLRGLLSVAALTRGFDVAEVEVLIMARPLRKSVAEFVQMLGRVMRTSPGKTEALVLDHSGNTARFWHEFNELFENGVTELDDGKKKPKKTLQKKAEAEPIKCPQCRHMHKPMPFCPSCGHEYPKRAAVEHVPGTLKELVATGDKNLMRRELWPQVCWYVKHKRNPRDDFHAQKMAQAIYAELTGGTAMARYETTTPKPCSSEVSGRIRANQQRWVIANRARMAKGAQRQMPESWGETREGVPA